MARNDEYWELEKRRRRWRKVVAGDGADRNTKNYRTNEPMMSARREKRRRRGKQ